jgi:hypothetical protein
MAEDPIPGVDVVVEKSPPGIGFLIGSSDSDKTADDLAESFGLEVKGNPFTTSSKKRDRFREGIDQSSKFSSTEFDDQFISLSETINNNAKALMWVINEIKEIDGGGGSGFPFTGDAIIEGTLNVNFTESLKLISTTSLNETFGSFHINDIWVTFNGVGDFIGYENISQDKHTFRNGILDGLFDAGAFDFPAEYSGNIGYVSNGSLSGSLVSNGIVYVDQTNLGGEEGYINQMFSVYEYDGQKESIGIQTSLSDSRSNMIINKTNNDGEVVGIELSSNSTGIRIGNTLSDDTASFLRITNNYDVTVFNFLNDNIVSDLLLEKNYSDDENAEENDIPVGGLYHTNGVLKIRVI